MKVKVAQVVCDSLPPLGLYKSTGHKESDTSERLSLHYTPWQGGCPGGHSTTLNNTGTSVLLELGVQQETASKQVTQVTIWLQWGQHQSRVWDATCASPGGNRSLGFPGAQRIESASNAGDSGLIPGSRRFPGEGNGNPL